MTELVQQRSPHDCAVACMAMLTGRAYEDVRAVIAELCDEAGGRRGLHDEEAALERLGFKREMRSGQDVGDFTCIHRGFFISAEFYRTMAWGRRALMSVPSLNITGGAHMIYWDGARVWDPSRLKTYTAFDQLLPNEMVLFREVRSCA